MKIFAGKLARVWIVGLAIGSIALLECPASANRVPNGRYRIDNPVSFGAHGAGWVELALRGRKYRYYRHLKLEPQPPT